ncbi:MAG: hypothetical protein KGI29_07640 [Pseudomonadota bacterium]|nr:hypothetical protein [Pseudomonadota bacterium]
MTQQHTLQSFLSARYLREWAGDKVFGRGEDYYHENCVNLLNHTSQQAIAEVEGSQPYRVEWKLAGPTAMADCTCPAMPQYGFCKHAVALGLMLIDSSPPRENARKAHEPADHFSEKYPNIAGWVKDGWIEIGRDGNSTSLIRVLDEGGLPSVRKPIRAKNIPA